MRRAAVEAEVEEAPVRRAEDDLADRRALVVDVAGLRVEPRVVEGLRAAQRDLLLRREDELDPRVRAVLAHDPPHGLEHDHDRGLVVGAEDRAGGVADDAVLADDEARSGASGGTVSVCAQRKTGRPSAVAGRRQ